MSESPSARTGDPNQPLVVCLGYPGVMAPENYNRIQAIDPRIEVVAMPADEGSDWIGVSPGDPHDEPPPWAVGVAAARRTSLARAHVMIALHIPKDVMQLAPNLRWLQGVGAGVEQFALAGVAADRVTVTNASGLGSKSMAEFVIGRLLAIWKHAGQQMEHQRKHEYIRTYGRTFMGSTIGIVGLGAIGVEVATRARALGCKVLGVKRTYTTGMTSPVADELFGMDHLHEMLAKSDAVVVAAPATDETYHLIDAKAFAAMRPGTAFVNVARGSLVDEIALTEAARSGHLGGIALDVFEEEPLPPKSPLWDLPNILISAHSSVSTDRYMQDVFDLFEENLTRYVTGKPLRNLVDMRALGFS